MANDNIRKVFDIQRSLATFQAAGLFTETQGLEALCFARVGFQPR
jgi:hypothetical protein